MQTHHQNIGSHLQAPFSSEFEKAGEDELVYFSSTETCLQNLGQMILFFFFFQMYDNFKQILLYKGRKDNI